MSKIREKQIRAGRSTTVQGGRYTYTWVGLGWMRSSRVSLGGKSLSGNEGVKEETDFLYVSPKIVKVDTENIVRSES